MKGKWSIQQMISKAKITYLIFSLDHFIPDVYVFDPVVAAISPVSHFDKNWFGICHAAAKHRREIASDCVLTDKHALYFRHG